MVDSRSPERPVAAWFWPVLTGALHALALSPWVAEVHAGLPACLQTAAVAALIAGLSRLRRPSEGARAAWLHGSVWLVGATGWMFVSLHRFGGLPAWLSALAVGLLCTALSGYLALLGAAWVRWRPQKAWAGATLFAALWMLAELARALIFTGFPWGASGYALIDTPFDRLAPWLGVYGLGAVWSWLVAFAVLNAMQPHRDGLGGSRRGWGIARGLGPLLGLAAGLQLLPPATFTEPHGPPLKVALLQSNVPQDEKFDAQRLVDMLIWHAVQLQRVHADLVVAPETAIPVLPAQLPPGYWDGLVGLFGPESGRAALIGVPLGSLEDGYSNSVVGWAGDQAPYRYDKHHLVPFGEFIPIGFRWFVELMNMPLGDFTRGPLAAGSFVVKGQRVAPNICYEDLFGEELATRFTDATRSPTILANVSNLAWFGDKVAIFQHLQIARMRSLEFQVPTIRSTNTGATVVIDRDGLVTHRMPTQTRGVLHAQVQGHVGQTPFAWWAGRFGLWPLIAPGVCIVGWFAWRSRRQPGLGAATPDPVA